jgi:hypothetical protein
MTNRNLFLYVLSLGTITTIVEFFSDWRLGILSAICFACLLGFIRYVGGSIKKTNPRSKQIP